MRKKEARFYNNITKQKNKIKILRREIIKVFKRFPHVTDATCKVKQKMWPQ